MGINPHNLTSEDFKLYRDTLNYNLRNGSFLESVRLKHLNQIRHAAIAQYVTDPEKYHCGDETFIRLFTQDIVSVGKDIVDAFAHGKYVNNSLFKCAEGFSYPLLFKSLLRQLFTKEGHIKDDVDLARLNHIRTIFMMYYKFELPFTTKQRDSAFQDFIEIDNSVQEDSWPDSHSRVRELFLSFLPDNPWDIRPRHGSGATNTIGTNNLHKVRIHRNFGFDKTPYRHLYRPSLFGSSELSSSEDFHKAKITVVPKDSRKPRIISMEPHERMLLELGLMDKIVEFQESFCKGTSGFVNYTDQTINQRAAYTSSITGAKATLDLKNASDLVSNSLIMSLVKGTDWEYALSLLRSDIVLVGDKEITLKKFACMGNALCFPIMATLIRAILFDLDEHTLVYGDDIIIDSSSSEEAIRLLHSYGLQVNTEKSFSKGPFRESCGGDFISGHNVNYVKIKSLSPVKFIAFANNISDVLSPCIADEIIKNYENVVNIQVFRSPPVFNNAGFKVTIPNVYNTTYYSSNDVFFKRRYDNDIQQTMYKIHVPGTNDLKTKKDSKLFGEDLLREWLYNALQYKSPLEEISQHEATKDLFHSQLLGLPNDMGEVHFQTDAKHQDLKWLSAELLGL